MKKKITMSEKKACPPQVGWVLSEEGRRQLTTLKLRLLEINKLAKKREKLLTILKITKKHVLRPHSLTNMFHHVRSLFSFSHSFHILSVTAIYILSGLPA